MCSRAYWQSIWRGARSASGDRKHWQGPRSYHEPAPDGSTFAISNTSSDATNLKLVALLPCVPAWIVARKTLPVADLKKLTVWLKTRSDNASAGKLGFGAPGKASAGIIDSDGPGHICTLLLQNAIGTNIQVVPYYSTASTFQGLVRGHIDFICDRAANSVAIVRSGGIKAYAVMAKTRWFAMPDIPTAMRLLERTVNLGDDGRYLVGVAGDVSEIDIRCGSSMKR
jgi:hypothetical protein